MYKRQVLDDVTVKIAEDGEILVKGPNVMMGYYNQPEKTAEVIDKDGWFHTGDIGTLVEGEYLKITDRKKEIFKTSGGKYIAPQVMENKFKESRFIEQIMVIGENQKMPAALVVPDIEFVKEWAKRKGYDVGDTYESLAASSEVKERIAREIENYNENFGKWEMIKVFELVPNAWTVEGGELTPTMKPKRKEVLKKCQALYDKIYG